MRKLLLITLLLSQTLFACPPALRLYPLPYTTSLQKEQIEAVASDRFMTHLSPHMAQLHTFNEKIALLPLRLFLHAQAYYVQPFPGQGKEANSLQHLLKKSISGVVAGLTFFPALSSCLLSCALRAIEHGDRPFLSYLHTPKKDQHQSIHLTRDQPLHLATFNVGLTPSSLNIKMDLRPPVKRAEEIAKSLLEDPKRADILIIEEGWHEGALKVLCTQLKEVYPHILHSVAPSLTSLSSGIAVFSLFAIEEAKFLRFEKMVSTHALPPRGVLRLKFATDMGPLFIYGGAHTQALDSHVCIQARAHQLEQLKQFVAQDKGSLQIIMGDLNLSAIDVYGHNNFLSAEAKVLVDFHHTFDDLFLRDHDLLTGVRTSGKPIFLEMDNARMKRNFTEPCASWYDGPFAFKKEKSQAIEDLICDRCAHQLPPPQLLEGKGTAENPSWGSHLWHFEQCAQNARFDYIVVPKNSLLDGRVEIRRIVMEEGMESSASDHLPVHALIWKK
jgi:endonuclease/exonuclease/phosphatase family metal-dependent hydrolase